MTTTTTARSARCSRPCRAHAFVVNGARADPDGALVSAGAEMKWINGFSLAATFEGEFSGNTTSYAGKGVAKYTW